MARNEIKLELQNQLSITDSGLNIQGNSPEFRGEN